MPLAPRIAKSLPPRVPRVRPGDSRAHLQMIRQLPCVVCGALGVDPHHLMRGVDGIKGMARRNEDRWCLPVCRTHHNAAHAAGDDERYFADLGIDARSTANALWANRGDQTACERIVWRARR